MQEDLQRTKETQTHAQTLYEREIRHARKDAFKASSAFVKNQEELKSARAALKALHSELDLERIKVARRDQDAFAAQYQLIGVQEELAQAGEKVKVAEMERDALRMSLKEEEVAKIAAEGKIPLPHGRADDEDLISPVRSRPSSPAKAKDEHDTTSVMKAMQQLKQELEMQRQKTASAEDCVEFMKMECQFRCCSCRIAEAQGKEYVHDATLDDTANVGTSRRLEPAQSSGREDEIKTEPILPEDSDEPAQVLEGHEEERQNSTRRVLESKPKDIPGPAAHALSKHEERKPGLTRRTEARDAAHAPAKHDEQKVELARRMAAREHRKPPIPRTPHHATSRSAEASTARAQHHTDQTTLPHATHKPTHLSTSTLAAAAAAPPAEPIASQAAPQLPATDFTLLIDDASLVSFSPSTAPLPRTPLPSTPDPTAAVEHRALPPTPLVEFTHPDFAALFTPGQGGHMTREEAMEQIRQRRGRARSGTASGRSSSTSRAASVAGGEGVAKGGPPPLLLEVEKTPRRDVSAPEMGKMARGTGGVATKGVPGR